MDRCKHIQRTRIRSNLWWNLIANSYSFMGNLKIRCKTRRMCWSKENYCTCGLHDSLLEFRVSIEPRITTLQPIVVLAAGLGADQGLGALGKRCQAMGRNAGWPENPVNHAERTSWLQGRGLSGRGHYAMVHRCHRWLQRVHQGSVLFFPRTLGHESIWTLALKNIYLRITRVMFV